MIKATKCGLKKKKKTKRPTRYYCSLISRIFEGALRVLSFCKLSWKLGHPKKIVKNIARILRTRGTDCVHKKGKTRVKVHTSQRPKRPELIPVSAARSCIGVLLLPPGRDASPSQGYPPSSMSPVHIYAPGRRETKWSKVPCVRKQLDERGLNPGPPDAEFEVLTARPHTPSRT